MLGEVINTLVPLITTYQLISGTEAAKLWAELRCSRGCGLVARQPVSL